MARKVYRVVPDRDNWNVTHEAAVLSRHYLKSEAIEAGKKVARANMPSQLVIHRADGTFETEYTYGQDPYPPVG